jgi:hypothetical protein
VHVAVVMQRTAMPLERTWRWMGRDDSLFVMPVSRCLPRFPAGCRADPSCVLAMRVVTSGALGARLLPCDAAAWPLPPLPRASWHRVAAHTHACHCQLSRRGSRAGVPLRVAVARGVLHRTALRCAAAADRDAATEAAPHFAL